MSKHKKIIYDFGSYNGDDIPYYMKKADTVIAVEANPILVNEIESRFSEQIKNNKLIVENCVLTVEKEEVEIPFYIRKIHHGLSQLPRPDNSIINDFDEVILSSKNVVNIIKRHGDPFYVKIDIEHYDHVILKELFLNDIFPVYISAESHHIETFALLVALGKYKSFNIVNGPTIESQYKDCSIKTEAGEESYSFPGNSAGPFGEDIEGNWMTPENFFKFLALEGLGWKDIHATNAIEADPEYRVNPIPYLAKEARFQAAGVIRMRAPSLYAMLKKIRSFWKRD